MSNLNNLTITDASGMGPITGKPLADNSINTGAVQVHFRNLEARIIEQIGLADAVVGCVAWMTNTPILRALSKIPSGVNIVVQKEDFLRPDGLDRFQTRALYNALPCLGRYALTGLINDICVANGTIMDEPVRCVGNHNREKKPAFARMHNKFLVFLKWDQGETHTGEDGDVLLPYAAWTGSFNLTYNATQSFENAVLLRDRRIASAYYDEWAQIFALSESLDWTSDWVAPDYRIGT